MPAVLLMSTLSGRLARPSWEEASAAISASSSSCSICLGMGEGQKKEGKVRVLFEEIFLGGGRESAPRKQTSHVESMGRRNVVVIVGVALGLGEREGKGRR